MGLSEAVYAHLAGLSALTTLVSTRIYPEGEIPNVVEFPYVTFRRTGRAHERHLTGGSGLAQATLEIDCWALSDEDADDVHEAIRAGMDNYRGTMGSVLVVRNCVLENDDAEVEPPLDASQVAIHRVSMTFTIWHAESVTP